MIMVSSVFAFNAFFVCYAVVTMEKAFFPQVLILFVLTFLMTLIGFHLGNQSSKTIASKKVELASGIVLIVMAVRLIIL